MDFALTENEKNTLLKLARETIELYVKEKKLSDLPTTTDNLKLETGAFVTIHKKGELRGCIGHMIGSKPLVNLIQEMAIAASSDDPRFPPVSSEELQDIDIEISVLSPMKRIQSVDEIEVGKHGILMGKGWNKGVLLPQVATEQGWDRDTFLQHTCLKAGLSPEDWKNPETIIEIFSAEIFSE